MRLNGVGNISALGAAALEIGLTIFTRRIEAGCAAAGGGHASQVSIFKGEGLIPDQKEPGRRDGSTPLLSAIRQ
jgi:hypothetical protein